MENQAQETQQTTVATVQHQPAAGLDLSQIKDLAGGSGPVTIVLAVIVLVGGGAGYKFWEKYSDNKQELALKQIEADKEAQEEIKELKEKIAELELENKLLQKEQEKSSKSSSKKK
jgi:predicted negative regulator of RcsB-dependent stress response